MKNNPLMKCGHKASTFIHNKVPYCVICDCQEIAEEKPNIKGRMAVCWDCGRTVPSNENLPFFKYKPNSESDSYYCGCCGWD